VVLLGDETILRWCPPSRAAWAPLGAQAEVPISGRNAKRVLWGALNVRTGHRIVRRGRSLCQAEDQAFLRELRRRYPGRQIWWLVDAGPAHVAAASQHLAACLDIVVLWLPRQCAELNAMDQLWKHLKSVIAANRQFPTVEHLARYAERWVRGLSNAQARRKAGMLSTHYWLKHL
jgi:hypothetical protein